MQEARLYNIRYTTSAARFLKELDAATQVRLSKRISALAGNPLPPGHRKVKGGEHAFRVRVGDYRVIYDVLQAEVVVLVLRVGHRKDVYR